jgi:Ca-activated chloride channel family protein
MPEAFHFVRPWWLLGIVAAVLLAAYWARRRIRGSHWEDSVAPELLAVLLEPAGQISTNRLPWIAGAALTLAALGLAGPSWERLPQPVEQRGDAMVIILDLSLSMLAEDIVPSRLVRARQKVTDILRQRKEGFTALVVYAGDAHAVVPLTDDTRTIENLLSALSPEMMPVLGSNLATALDIARELFTNSRVSQGRMLLVTDGVDRMSDATERRDPDFPLSILGVGTDAGAPIPLDFVNQPGEVLRSQDGQRIVARLDSQRLENIAEICYGRYRQLTLDDGDIDDLLATPLPSDDETVEVDREFDTWADQGFWVCVLLIPLLLAGFRRGTLVLLPMLLVPGALLLTVAPPLAHAGIWSDLWERRDQQAFEAIQEGEPEMAAALFEDPDWQAAALYRSGDYPAAAAGFSGRSDVTGVYNLGNALARLGEYGAAIGAYETVLAEDPDHDDATFNKALVEKLLEQQQSDQQQSDSQQEQGQSNPEDDSQSQGEGSAQQEQNDQQPGQQDQQEQDADQQPTENEQTASDDGQPEAQEQETQASRDERQDAMEQWLRRVPDDPGGLLRRKFQYETNQRLRRGEYRTRDSEKIW